MPENFFDHEFATAEEVQGYKDGVEAVTDLAEWEIIEETPTELTVDIDGEEVDFQFTTTAEKEAFKQGMEDGDGFVLTMVYEDDSEEYGKLERLLSPQPQP